MEEHIGYERGGKRRKRERSRESETDESDSGSGGKEARRGEGARDGAGPKMQGATSAWSGAEGRGWGKGTDS